MAKEEKKMPEVLGDQDNVLVQMESISRDGDRLHVRAALMGSWMTDMYMGPEDFAAMIPLALKKDVIWYVLSLPSIRRRARRATRGARA